MTQVTPNIADFLRFDERADDGFVELFKQDKTVLAWLSKIRENYFVPQPFEVATINGNVNIGKLYSAQIWVKGVQAKVTDAQGRFIFDNEGQHVLKPTAESRLLEYRSDFAAVALELVSRKNDGQLEAHWVMVDQYRLGGLHSGKTTEIPAGMLDGNGCVVLNVLRELDEETGLRLEKQHLISLGSHAVSSPWSNEIAHLFYARAFATSDAIVQLEGIAAGKIQEGEATIVRLVPERDMLRVVRDCMKNSAAYYPAVYEVRDLTDSEFASFVDGLGAQDVQSAIVPFVPSGIVQREIAQKLGLGS